MLELYVIRMSLVCCSILQLHEADVLYVCYPQYYYILSLNFDDISVFGTLNAFVMPMLSSLLYVISILHTFRFCCCNAILILPVCYK
jgi:hypothetical protein